MDIALLVRLNAAILWFIAFSLIALNAVQGSQAQSTWGFEIVICDIVVISLFLIKYFCSRQPSLHETKTSDSMSLD